MPKAASSGVVSFPYKHNVADKFWQGLIVPGKSDFTHINIFSYSGLNHICNRGGGYFIFSFGFLLYMFPAMLHENFEKVCIRIYHYQIALTYFACSFQANQLHLQSILVCLPSSAAKISYASQDHMYVILHPTVVMELTRLVLYVVILVDLKMACVDSEMPIRMIMTGY